MLLAKEPTENCSIFSAATRYYPTAHFLTSLHQFRGEGRAAQRGANELLAFAREQTFPYWQVMGLMRQGRELARQGTPQEGAARIRQGLAALDTIGTAIARTYWLALRAEAISEGGASQETEAVLTEALAAVTAHDERHWEAELYRLHGELALRQMQERSCRVARPLASQHKGKAMRGRRGRNPANRSPRRE